MREAYSRLFEPPSFGGRANQRHLEVGPYKALGRDAAVGASHGAKYVEVAFPDGDTFAPTHIRVTVRDPAASDAGGHHHEAAISASADAELAPPSQIGPPLGGGDGEYQGPFAHRQGKPVRPDVAMAFDRLDAAAYRHARVTERAALWAARSSRRCGPGGRSPPPARKDETAVIVA